MAHQAAMDFNIALHLNPVAPGQVQGTQEFVVLLLEDEPLIAMDIETSLGSAGFAVVTVVSCGQAIAWLDSHLPDVAIADIILRDGRCTEVAARLVEAKIPFIVHSGDRAVLEVGSPFLEAVWIEKPAPLDALLLAVQSAVGVHSA
jgi:DNA-binding response OmpR family regulator